MTRWRRRLLRGGIAAAALGAVAMMTLPWWWPAALAGLGDRWGITVGDWDTHGWSTVELHDVVYERDGLRVVAGAVRVPAFGRWPAPDDAPALVVRDATIEMRPTTSPVPAAAPPSVHQVVTDVMNAWPTIARWVPSARAEAIAISAGGVGANLALVTWDGTRAVIDGSVTAAGRTETIRLAVARAATDALQIDLALPPHELRTATRLVRAADALELDSTLHWRDQPATIDATFSASGLWPVRATFAAPAFDVPAATIGLRDYQPVRGALQGEWSDRRVVATITARAEPTAEAPADLPPLAVDVRATSDLTTVRVEAIDVRVPGLTAALSAPFEFTLRDPTITTAAPAVLSLDADLAALPWAIARGQVQGRVELSGAPGAAPHARFSLAGADIAWRDAAAPNVELTGTWTPEMLTIEHGRVQLGADSLLEASGRLALAERELHDARLAAQLTAAALRPWMPALPEFATFSLEAQAAGPLARPAHSGTLRWEGLQAAPGGALGGEFVWEGTGIETAALHGQLTSAADVTLPLRATVARAADGTMSAEVSELAWRDAQGEWWRATQPLHVSLHGRAIAVTGLALGGDALSLTGAADVQWPAVGHVTLAVRALDAARLAPFLPEAAHAARIDALDLTAQWNDGPVSLAGNARATYIPNPDAAYTVEAEFRTEPDNLAFGALRALDASGAVLDGKGRLPLHLAGRGTGFEVALPPDGEISLEAASAPNPEFWASIARLTRWEIAEPQLTAQIGGTLQAPRGRVEFTTAGLQPPFDPEATIRLPRLDNVKLVATADDTGLTLTESYLAIAGNWVSLRGRAPWSIWHDWRAGRPVSWRDADFAFAADRLPMAIASRAVPTMFAADGNVSFELQHEAARGLSGFLWLGDAALRPIAPLGSVRDISGEVRLDGDQLTLPRLGAAIGGRSIAIAGSGNVRNTAHPTFDLRLNSERVPLVRQQGVVLRAGLDLQVVQTADAPAHIAGQVELGPSVFISDLVSLLPTSGSVAAPEQRPPYFSVAHDPFARWTLDVAIRGEDFLRVENPFFRGTISADFHLRGTLVEPRLLGRAWADRGAISFPFGNLSLTQLDVALTEQNPYDPALSATAETRLFGYDVRLEASGSASDPRLLFSSDPPLSSQALFLMLTTGEMPDEEHAFTTGTRAQRLAMFVGRNLASSLGLIGGGDGGPERLIVRSGEDFIREGGETLYVQYNLDDRWALVGEKDRFGAYNGGIKFRIIDR